MSKLQHTPGPWHVDELDDDLIYDRQGKHIATAGNAVQLDDRYETPEEVTANARLIAAAPQMFDALELCEDVLAELARLDDGTPSVSALNMTRHVLAKAKGGDQ